MRKTGITNLPLHYGRTPPWLFKRMKKLAGAITEAIIYEYGQEEFLRRLSNPYWFQAFGCTLSFDWHSSGLTTVTCGVLKESLDPEKYGIKIAGGKGKTSKRTPQEIHETADLFSLPSRKVDELQYSSKMSAKVDNSCVQDGYQLYHHTFIFTEKGDWTVIQQGMGELGNQYARRYHWLSESIDSFVNEPHEGIACDRVEPHILDMTSSQSKEARKVSLDLINDGPEKLKKYFKPVKQKLLTEFTLPKHHPILNIDLSPQEITVLKKAYELQPGNYEELVSLRGIGPKKIRALALISDLLYGTEPSWKDPVKYSFSHGGKDGFPYSVDKETYDSSIIHLKDAIQEAKLDKKEKYKAMKRLKDFIY